MTPVTNNSHLSVPYVSQRPIPPTPTSANLELVNVISKEDKQMGLTDEGRALLAALTDIEASEKIHVNEDISDQVTSFTYGAFGMEHPDQVKDIEDTSYSAGQYLKGALSIGAMLLAIV